MWWHFVPLILLCFNAFAVEIPRSLNQPDREATLQILGLGTSSKLLTNPYPLGGHPGFEIGVSYEIISLEDLSSLGMGTDTQSDLAYPRFTIGKGLYADLDLYLHFTPFNEKSGLTDFGGFMKWGFYQAKFIPITFSLVVEGNTTNIRDELVSQTLGFQIVNGVNVNNFALYFGAGWARAKGRFLGVTSSESVTDSQAEEVELIHQFHSVIGASFSVDEIFLALQIDRYKDPTYSAKLGWRM